MPALPIIVKGGNLPLNFEPTAREYSIAFFRRLQIDVDGSKVILGSTDSIEPTYNAGPWLNNGLWMAWDEERAEYIPTTIAPSSNANRYILEESLTANRTITVPDKTGTLAMMTDVYVPRTPEGTADTTLFKGTTPTADWSLANMFIMRLVGNTTITFANVSPAQKVVIALINPGTSYTVTWPADVRWPAGVAPTQPVGVAGQNATGIYTLRESNVTGASRIYGDSFTSNAPSLVVTTGGPSSVAPNYGSVPKVYPTKNLP